MPNRSAGTAFSSAGWVDFALAADSPVRAASLILSSRTFVSRISAGTFAPEVNSTTSPGTTCSAGIDCFRPSRRTVAVCESISPIASRAFSALPSWMKPMIALTRTTARMTPVSIQCSSIAVTTAATSRM